MWVFALLLKRVGALTDRVLLVNLLLNKNCVLFSLSKLFFFWEQISKWLFELTNFLPFAEIWFLVMTSFPLSGYLIYPIFQKVVI